MFSFELYTFVICIIFIFIILTYVNIIVVFFQHPKMSRLPRRTPDVIQNLPLSEKEEHHHICERNGLHVFLSWYVADFKCLTHESQLEYLGSHRDHDEGL